MLKISRIETSFLIKNFLFQIENVRNWFQNPFLALDINELDELELMGGDGKFFVDLMWSSF